MVFMDQASKTPKKGSYLTFLARGLFLILGAFILTAYFFPISRKFHFTNSDEIMHFTGFAILGFMFAVSFPKYKASLSLSVIILLGIILELAQPLLTARRELSVADIIANGSGGLIGYILGAVIVFAALRSSQ